jgi:hypothetical protein
LPACFVKLLLLGAGIAGGNDYGVVPADDFASEIGVALGPPIAGIALDGEVQSFDVTQPAQLLEKRQPQAVSPANASGGTCRNDDRNTVLLRPLLRQHRSGSNREQ